jgi:hypothetical protein
MIMRNFAALAVVLASIFGGWVATPALAQTHPGLAPYTPSRIQWLAGRIKASDSVVQKRFEPGRRVIVSARVEVKRSIPGCDVNVSISIGQERIAAHRRVAVSNRPAEPAPGERETNLLPTVLR